MSDPKKITPKAKKRLLWLLLSAVVTVTLYIVLYKAGLYGIIDCLYILLAVLFVVVFYLSGAMAKRLPEKDELNPRWDDARKEKFLSRMKRNRELSIKLIIPLVPLMAVVAFDLIFRILWGK